MLVILALTTMALGPLAMFNLYFMPYWINVIWLDIVTYLHHHGSEDPTEKVPWYRGQVRVKQLLLPALSPSDRPSGKWGRVWGVGDRWHVSLRSPVCWQAAQANIKLVTSSHHHVDGAPRAKSICYRGLRHE